MRILECLTGTQGSAAKSCAIQHSTVPHQYCCATPVLLCHMWKDGLGMCYTWTSKRGRGGRTSHEGSKLTKHVFIKSMCWASLLNIFSLCSWSGHFFFLMGSQRHINIESYNKFWTLNSVPDIQRSRHLFIVNYVPLGRKCNRTWRQFVGMYYSVCNKYPLTNSLGSFPVEPFKVEIRHN